MLHNVSYRTALEVILVWKKPKKLITRKDVKLTRVTRKTYAFDREYR